MRIERARWEARYRAGEQPHDGPASSLLRRWLPGRPGGRALDMATGLGRNALYLARAGYRVDAVDIAPTALREAARRGRRAGLHSIRWIAGDLDRWRPQRTRYDVVVNAFFLKRRLFRILKAAVKPGGLLIFETHLNTPTPDGAVCARRRLRPGELRRVFGDWEVLYAKDGLCRESGRMLALGRIVARRPGPPQIGGSGEAPKTSRRSSKRR